MFQKEYYKQFKMNLGVEENRIKSYLTMVR